MIRYYPVLLGFFLSFACSDQSSTAARGETSRASDSIASVWSFDQEKTVIHDLSCADVATANETAVAVPVAVDVTPLVWPEPGYETAVFSGLELAGVWQLSSQQAGFGAFSGIVETPAGQLLLVSDTGRWLQLDLDGTHRSPLQTALFGRMLGRDGQPLAGKRQADAEGLAYREGIALVSFEQDHRVSAFALSTCGMAAREVRLTGLAGEPVAGLNMARNGGAEGLMISADGVVWLGIETPDARGAAVGRLLKNGGLDAVNWHTPPAGHRLTGLDARDGQIARVFRFYRRDLGNRIFFSVSRSGILQASGRLAPPAPVDNLEGIAFGQAPGGGDRLWLVSDDNVSHRQRTLLFAFDLH